MNIGLPLVLAFVMIGIGLTLQVDDFRRQRAKPLPSVVGIFGQAVLVPLLGFLVVAVFDVPPALAIGIILVAATSGGTTSNVMTYLARGNVALGLVLTVVTALLSILTLPFWVNRALQLWGGDLPADTTVTVTFGDVAGLLVAIIFVPVGLGMLIRSKKPALAARLERSVSLVSFVALFGLIIGVVASLGSEAVTMLRQAGPACLTLAILSAIVGLGLGIIFRLDRRDHLALGMEYAIKNVTLSMLIALSALGSDEMALPGAVYGVVAYVPGLALRWAAGVARATDRPFRVVMAWGMPTLGITPLSDAADFDRDHAEAELNAAVHRLRAETDGLEVDGELVRGKPAQGLLDRSRDAAVLVVGHETRSSFGRLVLGSVSSAVVTHPDLPVVLVRSDAVIDGAVWRQGPVVVGVDGSPGSEVAVTFAMEAAIRHGLSLVAVHTAADDVLARTGPSPGGSVATAAPRGPPSCSASRPPSRRVDRSTRRST